MFVLSCSTVSKIPSLSSSKSTTSTTPSPSWSGSVSSGLSSKVTVHALDTPATTSNVVDVAPVGTLAANIVKSKSPVLDPCVASTCGFRLFPSSSTNS